METLSNAFTKISTEFSWIQKTSIVTAAFGVGYLGKKIVETYAESRKKAHWIHIIKENEKKRRDYQKAIENQVGDLNLQTNINGIVDLPYAELHEQLQAGRISAVEVLQSYQRAALLAQSKTNCICFFIKEALAHASELDNKYSNKPKPALFGIPISIKESIQVRGYDSTRGYVQDLNKPAEDDALQVLVLKNQGAIPFVITNLPQSMLSFSCSNPIYGLTNHPLDETRSSGGSSGGEGVLCGMKASVFGIGSDVAGSVRVPAHFCGGCSLKPTGTRSSTKGSKPFLPGRPNVVVGTLGPMAFEVDALIDAFRCTINGTIAAGFDPHIVPLKFDENLLESDKKLTIGYYDYDGYFQTTASTKRAVAETKRILEADGHKLVPWSPPNIENLWFCYLRTTSGDCGSYLHNKAFGGLIDPLFYQTASSFVQSKLSRALSLSRTGNIPRINRMTEGHPCDAQEIREGYLQLGKFKDDFVKAWNNAGLDAILCPAYIGPSLPHEIIARSFMSSSYTALFNVVDFPAGVVKVTNVTKEDESKTAEDFEEIDYYDKLVKPSLINDTIGLPIGVQIVAKPFMEENCLRIMKTIENGVNGMKI